MKLAVVLTALATIATGVSAEKCVYANVAPQLHSLGTLITKCMTATDNSYNIARATEPPTPEQQAAICSKCGDFVDTVGAMTWPDCTMNMGGKDQTIGSYFNSIIGGCKAVDPPSDAPTTTAPAPTVTPTPTTPGSTTSAPEPGSDDSVTTAPTSVQPETKGSQSSSGSGSTAANPSDVSPAPSTPVPAPSSGYSLAVGSFAAAAVATTLIVVA